MSKLLELDAVLRIYESNFRNLHWNSVGIDFNDSHKSITTEYYETISKTIDQVAEIICMKGNCPCNYKEAIEIVNNLDQERFIVKSTQKYDRLAIVSLADRMLTDICELLSGAIQEINDPIDAGIKSELETMLYNYSLQARYINKRRTNN